jgi:hypothetical protein
MADFQMERVRAFRSRTMAITARERPMAIISISRRVGAIVDLTL